MTISNELLALLQIVIGIGVGWILKRAGKINDAVNQINGSVKELRTWTTGHEKLDDERFNRTEATHRDIWAKLGEIEHK